VGLLRPPRVEQFRAVEHAIATGVYPDMTEHGRERDDWPAIFERVIAADILVLLTPIWLGEKSPCAHRSSSASTATATCSTTPASTPTTAARPAAS
jgi:hypothetical protein